MNRTFEKCPLIIASSSVQHLVFDSIRKSAKGLIECNLVSILLLLDHRGGYSYTLPLQCLRRRVYSPELKLQGYACT